MLCEVRLLNQLCYLNGELQHGACLSVAFLWQASLFRDFDEKPRMELKKARKDMLPLKVEALEDSQKFTLSLWRTSNH